MTPIRDGEFVRRSGATLTLAGRPFPFRGNNVYFNQAAVAYGETAALEEVLDKTAALGHTVLRASAHNDHDPARDPAAIQLQPGLFHEPSLVALDHSIALAKSRGLRLILRFTNYWEAYGGVRRYVAWYLRRTPAPEETKLFYTERTIKEWFQHYIRTLLDRRNTVTGLTYRNEPAILAWELGNELRAPGHTGALLEWTAEMAAFLRQQDANHLIADGGEGFDDAPHLYPGLSNKYAVNGSEGCAYHRLTEIPELDLLSAHLYPSHWRLNDGPDAEIYLRAHHEIAAQAGKVFYLGEFGKQAPDAARAAVFTHWLRHAERAIVWHILDDARPDPENFAIRIPAHPLTASALHFSTVP